MKIFLDDVRNAFDPDYIVIRSYFSFVELIELLTMNNHYVPEIAKISFDHDLGTEKTGYDAMVFIEQLVHDGKLCVKEIFIHTANASAVKKMEQCAESIRRIQSEK